LSWCFCWSWCCCCTCRKSSCAEGNPPAPLDCISLLFHKIFSSISIYSFISSSRKMFLPPLITFSVTDLYVTIFAHLSQTRWLAIPGKQDGKNNLKSNLGLQKNWSENFKQNCSWRSREGAVRWGGRGTFSRGKNLKNHF
jgi:hypothetical protein